MFLFYCHQRRKHCFIFIPVFMEIPKAVTDALYLLAEDISINPIH